VVDQVIQGEICPLPSTLSLSSQQHSIFIFMFLLMLSEGQAVDSGNVKKLMPSLIPGIPLDRNIQSFAKGKYKYESDCKSNHKTYVTNELNEIIFFNNISKDINGFNSVCLSPHLGQTPTGHQNRAHPHQLTYSHLKYKTGQMQLSVLRCNIHISHRAG